MNFKSSIRLPTHLSKHFLKWHTFEKYARMRIRIRIPTKSAFDHQLRLSSTRASAVGSEPGRKWYILSSCIGSNETR